MNQIIAIARNTFREAIRNRILYVILMFALILILFSGLVSHLTISSAGRIIKDLGFTAINLFGVAIAVFVGVSLVYNELEKKTIYTIVSKPIGRWQFLLGKYFGLLMTVWVNIIIMTVFFLASLHFNAAKNSDEAGMWHALYTSAGRGIVTLFVWNAYDVTNNIMPVIAMSCFEMAIVTAFAVLYSSFTTPTLSMFFTVLTFIAGRMNEYIVKFADQVMNDAATAAVPLTAAKIAGNVPQGPFHPPLEWHLANWAAHIVPNLGAFHRTVEQAIYENSLNICWSGTLVYGLVYTMGILSLAILIFHRRNFK